MTSQLSHRFDVEDLALESGLLFLFFCFYFGIFFKLSLLLKVTVKTGGSIRNKARMFPLPFFNIILEVLTNAIGYEKEMKVYRLKGRNQIVFVYR